MRIENAKFSVYFEDPAGNILELIARHTMDNAVDRPFDPQQGAWNHDLQNVQRQL